MRAQHWQQTSGRGSGAHAASSRAIWTVEISYSYVINGEYYSGFASLPADDEKHAEGLALGWKDREILVRYQPEDPTESTLLLEDQKQPLTTITY